MLTHTLEHLTRGRDLEEEQAADLLEALTGPAPEALAGALLAALVSKGETAGEIRGFAGAMRRRAIRPDIPGSDGAVDIVGTGGDGSGSLNLSTGAALLTAACGQPVVKHGNRSVSSQSGSADVLEGLGIPLPTDGPSAAASLGDTGFAFLFAPWFHPAMAAIAPVRRALGIRTVFNILGPLTNPAEPGYAVIGVFDSTVARLMAEALSGMAIRRAFVLHGALAWDEATPIGPFELLDVRPGSVKREVRDPAGYGIPRCAPAALLGGDASKNAERLSAVFEGERGAHRDALALGAALALEVSGAAPSVEEGLGRAYEALADGNARRLLAKLKARDGRPSSDGSEPGV